MLQALNQNYGKILKKFPDAWKTVLYLVLLITWATILAGTYLLLN